MAVTDDSFAVSPAQWKNIETITKILSEPYKLTMELQRKNYILSDFFGDWFRVKRKLQSISHDLADSLAKNMERREDRILNNKLMLSSVYLDPRYNMLLKDEQKKHAVIYLCTLWCRLIDLNPLDTNRLDEDETDEFARFLNESSNRPQNITNRIEQFILRPSINYKSDISEYWCKIKPEEPELFKLAQLLFSIAVTQVDVERSFSSLKFLFNDYRSRLAPEVLSQLLMLRLNYDLAPSANFYTPNTVIENNELSSELSS